MTVARALAVAAILAATNASAEGVRLEYVAHACFVVESSTGTRVALDPYNGTTWLGYGFPAGLSADAVAITHPHYDHDASYYFGRATPVFRGPGRYQVGDIALEGVEGEHAGAPRFRARGAEPVNTVWVVEVDGVRIAHLGDNGALDEAALRGLGRVDVLIARATGAFEDLRPALDRLGVSIVIPNHYRIPELANLPPMLKTVDEWTEGLTGVVRHDGSQATLSPSKLPAGVEVHVLDHDDAVRVWRPALADAWKEVEAASKLPVDGSASDAIVTRYRKAAGLAPEVLKFSWLLGQALAARGDVKEATEVLESGLARAGHDDWTDRVRAMSALASLYAEAGELELAEALHRAVASERPSYAAEELAAAEAFLSNRR